MPKEYLFLVIGLIGIVPLIFLYYLMRKISKKNSAVINLTEMDSKNLEYYTCPKCKGTMENGYSLPNGIHWRPNTDKPFSIFTTKDRALDNTLNISFSIKENKAWRCRKCNLILIDHSTFVKIQ